TGAAHTRPRTQAVEESAAVHRPHRCRRIRLVRRNRRTHRHPAPAGPSNSHAVAGSPGTPRNAPEAVRRLTPPDIARHVRAIFIHADPPNILMRTSLWWAAISHRCLAAP